MSRPKVSVTMPCYNSEDTVGRAVESILEQSFGDFELLTVDDGSSDGTAEVLRSYARMDERVKPLLLAHQGVVGAANAAISAARGEYIARMDSDDISLPARLEKQVGLLDADPDIGLTSCIVGFGGDRDKCEGYACYVDWINTLTGHEAISLNRFVEFPFANPSIMLRRDLLDKHGAFRDGDFPEDYELVLRLLEAGVRMEKVEEELLVWNDPPDRLSRTHSKYSVEAFYSIKSSYLYRWLESGNAHHPEVMMIGSSRIARKRAAMLEAHGVEITGYVDIDPRKIGRPIGGKPVISRDDIPPAGECFLLSYVASRGAREEISEFLQSRGYVMGRNYLLVA